MKLIMEAEKRTFRVRKPLSDSTNLTNTTTLKTLKPNPSSAFKNSLLKTNTRTNFNATTVRSGGNFGNNKNKVSNPSSVPLPLTSTPSRPTLKSSSGHHGTGDCEVSEPCSVYSRRKTADKRKSKGKEIAMPFSSFSAGKIQNIGETINEDGERGSSKACTVPPKKKQRRQDPSMHSLSQDFIEQQRAYFAEIDAFELPEEEVESVEELE